MVVDFAFSSYVRHQCLRYKFSKCKRAQAERTKHMVLKLLQFFSLTAIRCGV